MKGIYVGSIDGDIKHVTYFLLWALILAVLCVVYIERSSDQSLN